MDFASARTRFAKTLRIACNGQADAGKLLELLSPYRHGGCPVSVSYQNGSASCLAELGEGWRVQLHDNLIQSLSAWLSDDNVEIMY